MFQMNQNHSPLNRIIITTAMLSLLGLAVPGAKAQRENGAVGQHEGRRAVGSTDRSGHIMSARERGQRDNQHLSTRNNKRINEKVFQRNFGSEHRFQLGEPLMVNGFDTFHYGGLRFGFINPWPEEWLYTDMVYVDYINGDYVLLNPEYPGVSIGLVIR